MSNSKSGNAPFSSFSSGPRSFQSKNLNNTLKPTASSSLSRDPKPSNANNLKGGMAVLVGKKQVTKSIGAAATPVPVNTPSLRSEIKSKDPWGGSATRSTPTGAASGAKPASWTKDATDASTLDATTSSPTPAGGLTSSTQPSADRGRNWAIKDDSDDDDDGPVQSNIRASDSGNQYNGNRSSNYLERDWGRENYHAEEEGDEGHSGGFHRQRPPGNSDTNWHQSRSNRDGYDDRRGSGYHESRGDHFGYRDRFDRPPSDRRFGNRDSRNNADVDNHPPILNSRARALSGELVAGEDDRDRDRDRDRGGDRDSHWRHHNNRHPDGDEDRPHSGRPQYNLDRDRDRHDRDRDSLPRNRDRDWDRDRDRDRDRPNRDGHPQRERAYSGSFAHTSDSHKNLSNKGYPNDTGPVSTAGSSGWQRVSTSVNSGSAVTTVLSKERMKVNQVSTTLLRPNREVVLATSSIAGPSMKVLTKQSINTSTLTGADGPPSGTNGSSNSSNAAAEVSDTSPSDSFGKTFASLLSAKERMDAAAAAGSSQRRDSYQDEGDEQDRVDHEYDEHDHYCYGHNSYSQDRRRRQGDDQIGRGGNRGSYYNREPYDDHNDDHEYYANNNGRTVSRNGGGGSAERGTGYSFSRHTGPPATVLPPRRKGGVLFEPKSGQFVEDNIPSAPREDAANSAAVSETQNSRVRKYSESSAHSTIDKKDSAIVPVPSTGAVAEEGGRWARVSVIKRGLAGSDSHVGTTSTTDGKQAVVTAPEKPPVLSKAQEEELKRAKYLEERKTLRTQERLARGPRTKGKLYRFNVNGDIEEVPAGERVVDGEASATHTNKENEEIESADKTEIIEETTTPSQTEPTEIVIAGPSDIANPVTESSQLVVPAPSIVAIVADHSTVANAGGASSTAGSEEVIHPNGGGKSPTTPRSSELVATASVFTPSQPLFTSLQQQQFQQLHAQQQQQQAPLALTPSSLPYPGLIDSNNLPVTPAGTNSASAPGPPIFMSSPGMTNVLFGNSPAAAGAPYGMTNTGMMSMNSGMMNNMGNMGNMGMSNMYYNMNMMPGMIMDNGSIYSMGGGNVGGLSWSNNNSVNTNTANTNSNTNAANPFMTNNSVFSSGSTWPVNANPNAVTTEDTNNSNSNPANVDAFASAATATSSVGGTTSGTVNSTATGGAMIGTMNVLSPQMSNWGNPRTTTNNSNLYGVMVSNDMDGNNNSNTSNFYYGGNATGMMGFFPNNTSGNAANNVMMSTDAMMFGNMAQQQQQQMYGTVSDFGYNVNYQAPMTGSASSAAKGDMFGTALSNNSAGAAGGGAQGSPALTGADGAVNNNTNTMHSQSSYYSINAGNNNNNNYNGMMAGNFNMYNSNNGGNMGGAGGYGRNSGYRNSNNFNANANNNNLNTMNFNSNNPSGGYGMNKSMQGGGSGGSFDGSYGNNNNSNNSGARNMYNAAPGGYTNRQQGRNYNNNNNYYNNAGNNNNYQQQQQYQR